MCTLLDAALGRTPNAVLRSKAGPSSAILNSILERHGQEVSYLHPPCFPVCPGTLQLLLPMAKVYADAVAALVTFSSISRVWLCRPPSCAQPWAA